ncbi:MAG: response regulator [Pyrinomonadaceae bacterium]|nr:response regulator [Pyrinomonadaceae bacterium]
MRIVCIDDDVQTASWIRALLSPAGVGVEFISVRTGREAFSLVLDDRFDLCILEYALPDMTGVQLCGLLRQAGCSTPIVFLTAMNRPIDRERAELAGANAYLAKPEDLDILVPTLSRLLMQPIIPPPPFQVQSFATVPT